MNATYDRLWSLITGRHPSLVQNRHELFAVWSILNHMGCKSLLEIGSACGGSALLLGNSMDRIVSVDLYEEKHREFLMDALDILANDGKDVIGINGNSMAPKTVAEAAKHAPYDVVFIDGSHEYEAVKSDYANYGPMAKRIVLFHDIKFPGPRKVFDDSGGGMEIFMPGKKMGFGVKFLDG